MRTGNRQINDDLKLVGELQDGAGSNGLTHAQILSSFSDKHTHDNSAEIALISDGDHDVISSGNPHSVTKSEVSLSNVPNLDTTDAVNNEHTHSNKALLDTYTQTEVDIADAISKEHVHANSGQLDLITDEGVYTLKDGTRAFTGTVVGVTPTLGAHLATKDYIDGLVQGLDWQDSVLDRVGTLPDTGLSTGDRYILTSDNKLYEYNGSGWDSESATEGMASWVEDEDVLYMFNGSAWVKFGSTVTHNNLSGLQGGTTNEFYHLTSSEYTELNGWLDNVTLGSSGALTLPQTLTITNSSGYGINLTQSGTGTALIIDNNGTGNNAISIDNTSTANRAISIDNYSTKHGIYINQVGEIDVSNNAFRVYSNTAQTTAPLSKFIMDNEGSDQTNLYVQQDGSGYGIEIDMNGDSSALNIHHDLVTAVATTVNIENKGLGHGMHIIQTGILNQYKHGLIVASTTAHVANDSALIKFIGNNTGSSEPILEITQESVSSTSTGLEIDNNGTGHGLYIHQDTEPDNGKYALYVTSNPIYTAGRTMVRFNHPQGSSAGNTVDITHGGTGYALEIDENGTGHSIYIHRDIDADAGKYSI